MRIASLEAGITEVLFALGAGSSVVCRDRGSDFPAEVEGISHVEKHDVDGILAHRPELVIDHAFADDEVVKQLKSRGANVVTVDVQSLAEVAEMIRMLGILVEREKQAAVVVASLQKGFNEVKKKAAHLSQRMKIYVEESPSPSIAAGRWVSEIVRLAGGVSVEPLSLDDLSGFDPDLIVLAWRAIGGKIDRTVVQRREGWEHLRAVREGRVRVIDDAFLLRCGPRLSEGARRLYGWMFETTH
ncbi:MAG: ABC transporter substrate-binding protein [Candidatus Peribacteraceae bacterium]|nr:ABC transporter substrate-binding protein [Candidatus Peribacteraceae bacterium]